LKAKRHKSTTDPTEVDSDGILVDIDVIDVNAITMKMSRKDSNRDLDQFFTEVVSTPGIDGKVRKVRTCKLCRYVLSFVMLIIY
jgi:hypothetical protein